MDLEIPGGFHEHAGANQSRRACRPGSGGRCSIQRGRPTCPVVCALPCRCPCHSAARSGGKIHLDTAGAAPHRHQVSIRTLSVSHEAKVGIVVRYRAQRHGYGTLTCRVERRVRYLLPKYPVKSQRSAILVTAFNGHQNCLRPCLEALNSSRAA